MAVCRKLQRPGVTKNTARGVAVLGRLGAVLRAGGWVLALDRLHVDPLDRDKQLTVGLLVLAADGADRAELRATLRAKLTEAWNTRDTAHSISTCLSETLYREISAADRADPPATGGRVPDGDGAKEVKAHKQATAIALLAAGVQPTEVAQQVGVHPKTLYRWPAYREAAERLGKYRPRSKQGDRPQPRGRKNDGVVEAWDETPAGDE
jgi:hypothetical protein